MSIADRLRPYIKYLKYAAVATSGVSWISYHVYRTHVNLGQIVKTNVLDREKKTHPEYIYIDDPSYSVLLKRETEKQNQQSVGFARIWKSLKHSLAWRLLWLCKHGNTEQRNVALIQLASFRNNKDWDCLKLAQAMNMETAVLLARTRGADLRYFLPPPVHVRKAAKSSELLSFKFRELITYIQMINPHTCIQHFLSKYFANVQEQAMESDHIPSKPDTISERDLCIQCLDAIYHHLNLFYIRNYEEDHSTQALVKLGLMPCVAEMLLRYPNDADLDLAVLRLLKVVSAHSNLLADFHQNGIIKELARLIKSRDVRLSSSAAVCLANLSGEYRYGPGLYLLHPIYRTNHAHKCDTMLVHGLRGGVFVTWRQRDRKFDQPVGLMDVTVSDVDAEPCDVKTEPASNFTDPEMRQVIEDLIELDDETLLSDLDVVLHDLPIRVEREPATPKYTAIKKRNALLEEEQDSCSYTYCWPKDWLPKDCDNLRILGVNYWSSLSDWLERCPLQTADIATRAAELGPALVDAGVGDKPVVWLAHSMGGLIVKQLLIEAAESEDEHKKLSDNTKAVLFYSTPHKGSSLATMPRAAAAVLWPSNDVRQLQVNSPVLLEIHDTFNKLADVYNWETISFAETKPTLVTAFKVPIQFVHSVSADLGRGVFYELPLDHLSICKPATRQSILYTTVLEVLQRVSASQSHAKYRNDGMEWLAGMVWWALQMKAKEVIESIDESHSGESLKWFERVLLDAFTDNFTD